MTVELKEADARWIEETTEALPSIHDIWHGREVLVTSGPLTGWRGVAGGPYHGRLEVFFPTLSGLERIWLHLGMLSLITEETS